MLRRKIKRGQGDDKAEKAGDSDLYKHTLRAPLTVPNRVLLLKSLNFFNWTGVCEEPSFHANVVTFWD